MSDHERIMLECRYILSLDKDYKDLANILNINIDIVIDDLNKKENSIIYYQGTYMPNTGIDYANTDPFDVLVIYDGTVIDVGEDELLGKIVKIRHNGELISVYQGIDNVEVAKGDMVYTGSKIATSGKSKINKDLGESLHLEIYKDGNYINPELIINKKIGDI